MATKNRQSVGADWESLNDKFSIAVGKQVIFQVVYGHKMLAFEGAQPTDDYQGYEFNLSDWGEIKAGSAEVWVKAIPNNGLNTVILSAEEVA